MYHYRSIICAEQPQDIDPALGQCLVFAECAGLTICDNMTYW